MATQNNMTKQPSQPQAAASRAASAQAHDMDALDKLAARKAAQPQADKAALSTTLSSCLTGGDGTASLPERAARTAKEVGSVVWRSPGYAALAAVGALVLGCGLILRGRRRGRASWRRRRRSASRR